MITLARELTRSLENPIWEAVRGPAPWSSLPAPVGGNSVTEPLNPPFSSGGGSKESETAHG